MQSYMRIFGQEGIGRPDLEAETEVAAIKNFLAKKMEGKALNLRSSLSWCSSTTRLL